MTKKPVRPRTLARRDIATAVDHYVREAGRDVALGFIDALQASSFRAIINHPAAGSLRYAQDLTLPGLRSRSLRRYPYLVFYVERDDYIDVWRVVHVRRDIPARMRDLGT